MAWKGHQKDHKEETGEEMTDTGLMTAGTTEANLTDLAERINAEHAASEDHAKSAIEHALQCGQLLIEAKAQVKHGQWLPWLEANCTVKERQARNYMRLADNWEAIESKSAPVRNAG